MLLHASNLTSMTEGVDGRVAGRNRSLRALEELTRWPPIAIAGAALTATGLITGATMGTFDVLERLTGRPAQITPSFEVALPDPADPSWRGSPRVIGRHEDQRWDVASAGRLVGSPAWVDEVEVAPGAQVQILATIRNTGTVVLSDLAISFAVPDGLEYQVGSTRLRNAKHPDHPKLVSDAAVANGIDISSYTPESNAHIWLNLLVGEPSDFRCGRTTLPVAVSAWKGSAVRPQTETRVIVVRSDC